MDGVFVIAFILFIVLTRELWTWYLKTNKLIDQNNQIIDLLKKIVENTKKSQDEKKE